MCGRLTFLPVSEVVNGEIFRLITGVHGLALILIRDCLVKINCQNTDIKKRTWLTIVNTLDKNSPTSQLA